jgi:hypothetical protein
MPKFLKGTRDFEYMVGILALGSCRSRVGPFQGRGVLVVPSSQGGCWAVESERLFRAEIEVRVMKHMAEHGEWNRKGATLSNVTAQKEYGVSWDFIVKGIQAGKLEYREGSIWGNPYLRVLRRQLERYIAAQLGSKQLATTKTQTELRKVSREIAGLKKKLTALQIRKAELEKATSK